MQQFKVLVPQAIAAEGIYVLKDAGCEVVVPADHDLSTLKNEIVDCEAVLVRTPLYLGS
ncbi:hypothetical protein [Jeotgalibacillus soli]|uniref:Uncharacterized protein n=1 Tax=Jeotgalibacillus soli TaxID=889306 RepID=A0A0C2W6C6_9BACL|nr:hypothetical protein [Jeotgalibacillus soli]KIL52126.1 hypothetical protein KP78_04960 [Jeotgalibacillus soli]